MAEHPEQFQTIKPVRFAPSPKTRAVVTRPHRYTSLVAATLAFFLIISVWYLFGLRALDLELTPPETELELDAFLYFHLQNRLLVRPGQYDILLTASGYAPLETKLLVEDDADAPFIFKLDKLPGQIELTSIPTGAKVQMGTGTYLGQTPIEKAAVPAGLQTFMFSAPRYQPQDIPLKVEGKGEMQSVQATLKPDWADVRIQSQPAPAQVFVDDVLAGTTPGTFALLAGTRVLKFTHPGRIETTLELDITARQPFDLPVVELPEVFATLNITSIPTRASILIDGNYFGQTPLTKPLTPKESHRLILQKPGYQPHEQSLTLASGEKTKIQIRLQPTAGDIRLQVTPEDADIFADGIHQGQGSMTLSLPATEHELTIKRAGYTPQSVKVLPRPNASKALKIDLVTREASEKAKILPAYQNDLGQKFKLIMPGVAQMGADRSEEGFQIDQIKRDVSIPAAFYLGITEVTNADYRQFRPNHSSGTQKRVDLDPDTHPVVQVSWLAAVRYCNWLSERENLTIAYLIKEGKPVQFVPEANGYRLPTEAEWAWVARQSGGLTKPLQFPWGNASSPSKALGPGNFASSSAKRNSYPLLRFYRDGYLGTAPVGSFPPDKLGLYDLHGNVSEWINDYYHPNPGDSYAGPPSGKNRVIRGSNWQQGSRKELRAAFRQNGVNETPNVGFRLARTP